MNEVNARAVPVMGGWRGEMRKVHKAEYEPVCRDGVPVLFASALEAEVAAWRALKRHLCADLVGSGEKMSAARSKAEEMFGAIFKGGRRIVVTRR